MTDFANSGMVRRGWYRRAPKWLALATQLVVTLPLLAPMAAAGDKPDAPKPRDPEVVQQLLVELQELRARVSDLEARLAAAATPAPAMTASASARAEPATPSATATLASPAPAAAAAPAAPAPAPRPVPQDSGGLGAPPSVKLRLLGDAGYHVTDLKGDTNTFYVGSLDMLMTGNISDRTSVLGEVLFTSGADNSFSPDVERLLLNYKYNDHFAFGVGRYHTSIGYYNPTYHRGAWFETAIGRPFMYAFDDNGGSFPLQEIGVTTNGKIPSGFLGLQYVAEIGNGRNHAADSEPAQNRQDINNGKSFNFALSSHPSEISGLDMGFSVYHDVISSEGVPHSEMISTVHVVYSTSKYELLNEAALIRHVGNDIGGPGTFNTPAFYTELSRGFGKYRPYFRYQYINAGVTEPVYGENIGGAVIGRRNGPSLGVRFDFTDHAAWKLQYDYLTRRGSDDLSDRTVRSGNGLATEFSFAF